MGGHHLDLSKKQNLQTGIATSASSSLCAIAYLSTNRKNAMEPIDYMNALFAAVQVGVVAHLSTTLMTEDDDARKLITFVRGREVPLVMTHSYRRTLRLTSPDGKYASLRIEVEARFGTYKRCDIDVSVNGTNYDVADVAQMTAHLLALQEVALVAMTYRDRFLAQNP